MVQVCDTASRPASAEGREAAASRWYAGDGGPTSDVAAKATARCSSCGYFVPMAGALRATFGVCANESSPSDGRVVSLDHGCGAHSETDADQAGWVITLEDLDEKGAVLCGDPDRVIEVAKRYEVAGCEMLMCLVNPYKIPQDKVMESIELIGKHVLPEFQH